MFLTIHQPQYLPWFPYFKKIIDSDLFIFLDNVQYQKNGLINRNQILNNNGKFWLTVPVLSPFKKKICDVKIDNKKNWQEKHIKSIEENYKKSKNFAFFTKFIKPIYFKNYDYIADLNIEIISTILENFFEKRIKIIRQKDFSTNELGSNLILEICKKFKCNQYISGPGGKNYLDLNDFKKSNIEVIFNKNIIPKKYYQINYKKDFIGDISIIDFILNFKN